MKIPAIFKSKKFQALIGALVLVFSNDSVPGFLELSSDSMRQIVMLVLGYLGAQGIADHGKEKVKAESEAQGI